MRWMLAVAAVGTLAGCPADDVPATLDGAWSLTWTCTAGCDRAPTFTSAPMLTVEGGFAAWNTEPPTGFPGSRDGECLAITNGAQVAAPGGPTWAIFDLAFCADGDDLHSALRAITDAGAFESRWEMVGTR